MIIPPAQRLSQVKEYYFSIKLREIRQRMASGEDIINLGIGSPDLSPSEATLHQLIEAAQHPQHHAYQPYKGILELRAGFAGWYKKTFGVNIDAHTDILPLMGSKEGIMHISMAFLNPGDEVLVPNPGYPTYASVTRLVGATIRSYSLKDSQDWTPNFDELEAADLSKVKLMWINYPHMPTGTPASDELMTQLIEFAHRNKILLCHDNPYSLVLNPHPKSILQYEGAKEVAIELNSLSKSHNMAGWRIGAVVGKSTYIQEILKVKSNMDSGMFKPLQLAAATALSTEPEWHTQRNATYQSRREIAWELLHQLGCTFRENQAGMFVWAKVPEQVENGELFSEQILNETHVFLTPGFIFGSEGDQYLRISLCTEKSRLQEACQRIQQHASFTRTTTT